MEERDHLETEVSEEERALRDEVTQSEQKLAGLERELRGVDEELENLEGEHRQYQMLEKVCKSLEELDGAGAAHLFWEDGAGPERTRSYVHSARQRIDGFGQIIAEVQGRREAIVGRIGEQNNSLDYLHYDLRDAMERAESVRNEWLVEREADHLPYRQQVMPWARGCEEDQRFRHSLAASILLCLLLGWFVTIIDVPILDRLEAAKVPERVAKLVREELPPPPPPVEEPVVDEPEPEEPELAEEKPPEQEVPEATEQPVVAEAVEPDTREQVKSKGILAFRDSFAERANLRPTAQLGSQARISNAGEDAVGRPERAMVTTSAPGSSGGINLADISREVGAGGDGLAGVQVTRAASSIGGAEGPDRPLSAGVAAGRTDEEIQIVFDRYKAALYRLYNRELRRDPTLRGQIILRLTIEPDGSVSLCQLQASDMNAPMLAEQVIDRVLTFDFGAKDVAAMTIIYPIDFLPAA